MIEDIEINQLKIISTEGGDVLHGIKASEKQFDGFGDAYFSTVNNGAVKGWKKHLKMTLNLMVPVGKVGFVFFDDREDSQSINTFQSLVISTENYYRLTVPPGIWFGFKGLSEDKNLLLNVANIEHDPDEAVNRPIHEIKYDWSSVR